MKPIRWLSFKSVGKVIDARARVFMVKRTDLEFSVVIPTHNRSDALKKTLEHLSRQIFPHAWEVIVINNRCSDDTDQVVERFSLPVPLRLLHEEKPGVAAARNAGIRAAQGNYVVFLDNDILVEPDFLDCHYRALQDNPGCWIMGQIVNLPEQQVSPFGQYRNSLYGYVSPEEYGIVEAHWLAAPNTSMPKEDLDRLGGFDEKFGGASVEDYDLAMRAWEAGVKILFHPSIMAIHNDWAGYSIRDYCRRQRLYTQQEPLFWKKYGDRHPRPELIRENLPPRLGQDGPGRYLRKSLKRLLAHDTLRNLSFAACEFLERLRPAPTRLLWPTYRLLLSVSIYAGFQEGLRIYGIDLRKNQGRDLKHGESQT